MVGVVGGEERARIHSGEILERNVLPVVYNDYSRAVRWLFVFCPHGSPRMGVSDTPQRG